MATVKDAVALFFCPYWTYKSSVKYLEKNARRIIDYLCRLCYNIMDNTLRYVRLVGGLQ